MTVLVAKLVHRCRLGFETVCDDRLSSSVPLQSLREEPRSRRFVPFPFDVALQDLALVIECEPQIVGLAMDVCYAALRVTKTPSTCQRQLQNPRIPLIRCRLMSAMNIGPSLFQ